MLELCCSFLTYEPGHEKTYLRVFAPVLARGLGLKAIETRKIIP